MAFPYELFARYVTTAPGKLKSRLEGELVQANLPFVKSQARKFAKRTAIDIDMEDLIQAGTIGLLFAIRKYNPEKARFSTYATWWCLREMQWWAAKNAPIRRPKGVGLPYRVWRTFEKLLAKNGEEPTDADLELTPGSIDAWKQTPVFFPMEEAGGDDDHASDTKEKYRDLSLSAEENMLEEEQLERAQVALLSLPREELLNFRKVYVLKRGGNKDQAEETMDCIREFMAG